MAGAISGRCEEPCVVSARTGDTSMAATARMDTFAFLRTEFGTAPANLTVVMKALSEYTRLFVVYMSFAVFLAAEAAAIFLMYRHLGII